MRVFVLFSTMHNDNKKQQVLKTQKLLQFTMKQRWHRVNSRSQNRRIQKAVAPSKAKNRIREVQEIHEEVHQSTSKRGRSSSYP